MHLNSLALRNIGECDLVFVFCKQTVQEKSSVAWSKKNSISEPCADYDYHQICYYDYAQNCADYDYLLCRSIQLIKIINN